MDFSRPPRLALAFGLSSVATGDDDAWLPLPLPHAASSAPAASAMSAARLTDEQDGRTSRAAFPAPRERARERRAGGARRGRRRRARTNPPPLARGRPRGTA